ncbi:ABC transporter substrate-binding protein [Roseburia hominis]
MNKMKKFTAVVLVLAMVLSLAACGKKTSGGSGKKTETTGETIRLLGYSYYESTMNILRDQLTKAGFEVELNMQPDYSSMVTVRDTGEWDLCISGWTTVTGNPDYAARDVYASYGQYNAGGINDPKVDELIDKASTQTPSEYAATYKELEDYAIIENVYSLPLYAQKGIRAINNTVVDESTVLNPQSRSAYWENYSYVDESQNATRTLMLTQTMGALTSLDPIQANDGSINQLSANLNVRIVNMTPDDQIVPEGSLSRNIAIGEGNSAFYFILRDDVYFSRVENKHVVATDVRVGAEDVEFSLERAADKDSVASHKTYNLHNHMSDVSIVTDIEELKNINDADTGKPVFETLSKDLPSEITTLTADKTQVDNANGVYQVVKISTENPFPQVLYYLAHQSAGILNKEAVTEMNSKFDVATYDPTKDVCYGDPAAIKAGNNHLWMSGPYALVSYDDYQVTFEKNPGYMAGTEHEAKISNVAIKFIKDATSATSDFRAGGIDILDSVATNDVATLEENKDYTVYKYIRHATSYCDFNMKDGNKFENLDLRKAVYYAINEEEYIAYNNELVGPLCSTFSTLIDTGNTHEFSLEKSAEHLAAYQKSAGK